MIQRWAFCLFSCLSLSCAGTSPPPSATVGQEENVWPDVLADTLLISNQPSLDRLQDSPPGIVPPERSEAAMREGVRKNFHLIGPCFAFVRDNPDLQGVVKLDLTITPDGRVRDAEVIDNTTGNRGLAGCLASAATLWIFEPVDEIEDRQATVALPFRLR